MLIKVVRLFLLFIVIAFLVSLPRQVQALGIGVAPHQLRLEAYPLGSATSSLDVFNTSNERSEYQVYVDGECENWFSITPEEFLLDAHSNQEVTIVVSPPLTAFGEHSTTICVVSLTPASKLKVGCGVKIPVYIEITPPPPLAMLGINVTGLPLLVMVGTAALLIVALVVGIFIWRRRKAYET